MNNMWLGAERYTMETGSGHPLTYFDYNGYCKTDDPDRFIKWFDGKTWTKYMTLAALAEGTGFEKHGIMVTFDMLTAIPVPAKEHIYDPAELDFRLQSGSTAIDAGVLLDNINEGFTGSAPDLGALEYGAAPTHYGPRPEMIKKEFAESPIAWYWGYHPVENGHPGKQAAYVERVDKKTEEKLKLSPEDAFRMQQAELIKTEMEPQLRKNFDPGAPEPIRPFYR